MRLKNGSIRITVTEYQRDVVTTLLKGEMGRIQADNSPSMPRSLKMLALQMISEVVDQLVDAGLEEDGES